jgi:uncharacterized protein
MEPRISMITLGVDDVARAAAFYGKVLGLQRLKSSPEVAFFPLSGTWLGLFGRNALAQDAGFMSRGDGFNSFTLSHNVTSPTEVDALIDHALQAGATLVKKPQTTSWGGYSGYFSDPDGHLWEVAHNPHFWVGPPASGA